MTDNKTASSLHTITLGMGCYWSPEALFGAMPGIIRTRVGFAGGTTDEPSYRDMGDHTETVELTFDPAAVSYDELLETFWNNHKPMNINGYKDRQYQSLLLYRDEAQEKAFRRIKSRLEGGKESLDTELSPFRSFYPAESRHQKYYLKRFPDAVAKLSAIYPSEEELQNATLAARLNGVAKGFLSVERLQGEMKQWALSPDELSEMLALVRSIRW
ncbi:peptide-methionine (S)-S-oxide reductase MsrA [Paenibacillus sacheonensis]|uniref:peptide-methionine (S)-S-oxide reductase n=1 Tax=Paenibacillus sacheonensis TaxID=742054 RepID=A0A7X5C283_9BACL|nr:peptide-methionine (S)-S-oxide reductase [Paenibacillus sacheonensis]MBM7567059.1 peptide-methionine (S)-S-oxide reductase [Paenibacillus sacheonensis]NBC71010.1 peptide methionine sulfoxide reductase [Paenibacillus sacheonensis]